MPRCAFIVGAPRSGTSWLQFMVGSHAEVVTPQELDLLSDYIPPLWAAWERELRRSPDDRIVGLTTALTEEEFEEQMRKFVAGVYERVLSMKPGAALLVEKVPAYSLHVQLINRLLPDARFVHVIRDGRDVVTSLTSASRGWGRKWAPTATRQAAVMWRDYVVAAQQARAYGDRYVEVRYEDLLGRGAEELLRLFGFLGVDADEAMCEQIVEANSFERASARGALAPSIAFGGEALRRFGRVDEPTGFFRSGRSEQWKSALTERDKRICDEVFGALLRSLGYETEPRVATSVDRAMQAARRQVDHLLRGSARRAGRKLQSWGAQ